MEDIFSIWSYSSLQNSKKKQDSFCGASFPKNPSEQRPEGWQLAQKLPVPLLE